MNSQNPPVKRPESRSAPRPARPTRGDRSCGWIVAALCSLSLLPACSTTAKRSLNVRRVQGASAIAERPELPEQRQAPQPAETPAEFRDDWNSTATFSEKPLKPVAPEATAKKVTERLLAQAPAVEISSEQLLKNSAVKSPPRIWLFGDQGDGMKVDAPQSTATPVVADEPATPPMVDFFSDWNTDAGCQCLDCPSCDVRQLQNAKRWRDKNEYVCDGGDEGQRARIRANQLLKGVELEDTIGHFDTIAGETVVVPSTKACVYSPRFAATRQVRRAFVEESWDNAYGVTEAQAAYNETSRSETGAMNQPLAAVDNVSNTIGFSMQSHQKGDTVDDVDRLAVQRGELLPFENLTIIRRGKFDVLDRIKLASSSEAAGLWSAVDVPVVAIDNKLAYEQKGVGQAEATVMYKARDGQAKLRLVKLASTGDAHVGDEVVFTIRFDNVGEQAMGNVTIIDNLTTRLEYVEDSEECSVEGEFFADDNVGQSLELRWEISEPLEPGEGGVIRFRCKVR